jgi:biotin carboxyl carrier protein
MTLDEIKELIEFIKAHELSEFEFEKDGVKVRIKTGGAHHVVAVPQAPVVGSELAIVKSPIVGTFYRAAEPGAKAFVSVGDTVRKGQVLCIIEAMKLMNEIDSEYDGEVVSIYVENGQAVQYGERLFAIRPSA